MGSYVPLYACAAFSDRVKTMFTNFEASHLSKILGSGDTSQIPILYCWYLCSVLLSYDHQTTSHYFWSEKCDLGVRLLENHQPSQSYMHASHVVLNTPISLLPGNHSACAAITGQCIYHSSEARWSNAFRAHSVCG